MTLNEQGLLALLLTWQGAKFPHNPQVCRFKSFDSQCMFMHRIDRNDTPINTILPSSQNALTLGTFVLLLVFATSRKPIARHVQNFDLAIEQQPFSLCWVHRLFHLYFCRWARQCKHEEVWRRRAPLYIPVLSWLASL